MHGMKRLGNSDMELTPIGFGAWAIGGPWKFGWGVQDDDASIRTIHAALDAGINWIDTAAVYGLGHSEEVVAKALKSTSAKPYVFTKCSMTWDDAGEIHRSLKSDSIRSELEASLRRLNVETIDLYQIHWPVPDTEIEEGWETMAKLKEEGKVRWIGVSNFSVSQLERCRPIAPVTSNQPPLNLIRRDVTKDVLPYCAQHDIGVIVYSPMASGLLSGRMSAERVKQMDDTDWRKGSDAFNEPQLSRNLALAELLASIGRSHDATAGEVAIAWVLRQRGVTAAIVGMRSPEQVAGVVHGGAITLSDEDIARIEAFVQ
jgi:aryl-alcohol dehydrogenase-like predicted oxidoreductase